jgi:PAS domain S-box-containing protein
MSETKYYSLFENASEAILSFRPGEGRIIEANAQTARLLGRERDDLLQLPFVELFTPECYDQAQWLVDHPPGTGNMRLENMFVRRADGQAVPVALSCTWVEVEGQGGIAQAIIGDVSHARRAHRELRDYADQLEVLVRERTRELEQSQRSYRALFLQEQRRAQHLSLVNTVGHHSLQHLQAATSASSDDAPSGAALVSAVVNGGIEEFLHSTTRAIHHHFATCDVTFYLCESAYNSLLRSWDAPRAEESNQPLEACGDLIAVAEAGGNGLAPTHGARHPFGVGLPGLCAQNNETILIAREAMFDPRYLRPPGVQRDSNAQLCVPVAIENVVAGVVSLQCSEDGAFDARDTDALQTVAGIVAGHLQASRIFREKGELSQFHQTLIDTMVHSLLITGQDETIRVVNTRLCQTLRSEKKNLEGQPLSRALGEAIEQYDLRRILHEVRTTGTSHEMQDIHVRVHPPEGADYVLVFDLRMFRIFFRGEPQVAVLMINVTQRWRREQEMRLINETGRLFQTSLDVDTVLHTVLTCITAGSALGFNRAFVFLQEENDDLLRGAMALGPSSEEEAGHIWWELLQERVRRMALDLANPALPAFATVMKKGHALLVAQHQMFLATEQLFSPLPTLASDGPQARRDDEYRREYLMARELFIAKETAIAPLTAKDRIIGVVLADNLYSNAPIDQDQLQLLDTLARHAGLAIDNAQTYKALQQAQNDLLAADRLVVIGELAARISHEIRNPLATIGGWARNLQRAADNPEEVLRKAGIIRDEVNRLEGLLTAVLGMAKARPLNLEPHSINEIIERALLLAEADIKANKVEVQKSLADIPIALLDRSRLLQALLNIIRNGAQAMSEKHGGTLYISTSLSLPPHSVKTTHPDALPLIDIEVRDEGRGISAQALRQVFDPFFSTKLSGSGLGLSVTRRIVQDHGGEISVESQPGEGTAFVLRLPLRPASKIPATEVTEEESYALQRTNA